MAAYNYDDGPEKEQEAWRQEQIASTGVDPCTEFHEGERERRVAVERIKNGDISEGEMMTAPMNNRKYEGMTWEERRAAQDHALEMYEKCPPLDFIEPLN